MDTMHNLRGAASSSNHSYDDGMLQFNHNEEDDIISRILQEGGGGGGTEEAIVLSLSLPHQIALSSLLGSIALVQILLLSSFIRHRSKRVLEFAQPIFVCVLIGAGVITTLTSYLFIFQSNIGCIVREPLIFISLSVMGATIAGRAWRISSLINGPLLSAGNHGRSDNELSHVEKVRQLILRALTAISGCNYNFASLMKSSRAGGGRRKPLRVQITNWQMTRATTILIIPQLLFQIVVMGVPSLRSTYQMTYSGDLGLLVGQYQCKSSAVGAWTVYVSIFFTLLPHVCAYVLNCRPKAELDQSPDICNERGDLELALAICFRGLVWTLPTIAMTWFSPNARVYVAVSAVLVLPLSLCYHVAYVKLSSVKNSTMVKAKTKYQGRRSMPLTGAVAGGDEDGRSSAAVAMRLAEMYQNIGRTEETIQLVDETLGAWQKGSSNLPNLGPSDGRKNVGSGFTRNDLKNLDPDELQLIIELLGIKSKAIMELHGQAGMPMSAKLNVDALKIFENCPSASQLKDISIIFPVYSLVGMQIKLGIIDQDDNFSLEMELAERYIREARIQTYHYCRALINLAELYGRKGDCNEALKLFEVMESVYMPNEHPSLLSAIYNVDRSAIGFASSALWYLQKGDTEMAVERCEYVAENILPSFDDNDIIGIFSILLPLIRVLKFNGQESRAYELYKEFTPDGIEQHFAVGDIHKPLLLLLELSCDEYTDKRSNEEDISVEIELALTFNVSDMADNVYRADCWSIRTMSAELCQRLAIKLKPGSSSRMELVDKGIQMATVANKQSLSEDTGLIKHILAYEANSAIYAELLKLAQKNNSYPRGVIHDVGIDSKESYNTEVTKSDLARRLIVNDGCSNGSGQESKSAFSAPSNVHISAKKKVTTSRLSSLENVSEF